MELPGGPPVLHGPGTGDSCEKRRERAGARTETEGQGPELENFYRSFSKDTFLRGEIFGGSG